MNHGRLLLVPFLIIQLVMVSEAAPVPADRKEKVTEKDIHSEAQAWQYSGVDLAQGQVLTITAAGGWKINSGWKGTVGAGGKSKTKAGNTYVKPGVQEGCLLVRTGDDILVFTKDDDKIVIKTLGKVYFCANDEPTEDGATRFKELLEGKNAKDYIGAVPIAAPTVPTVGVGFLDNFGTLRVRLTVTKAAE